MFSFLKSKPPTTASVADQGVFIEVARGKTLLEAALEQGLSFPHNCKVGTCGTCLYRLDGGKISELTSSAMGLTQEQFQAGYRLACQTLPKTDLTITLDEALKRTQPVVEVGGRVASLAHLTHDIVELRVDLDEPIRFQPGQYAELLIDGVAAWRSYSFANPPHASNASVHFHVRLVPGGQFTGWLFAASRLGQAVRVRGPYGQFGLKPGASPIICVAGGSGLAPIKCMLEGASPEARRRPVIVLFGARTERDIYGLDAFEALKNTWEADLTFTPILSAEPADSSWTGGRGLVTDYIQTIPDIDHAQAYLCGPPPMVDAAEAALSKAGLTSDRIFADRFFDKSRVAAA
ncbi:2Fe-2S iron-sulfur cluster binding domain-containing protein [Sphingomonas sp. TF3]|uniref:2Fe-2S iron-sulfur cluster-binding protein n=1 Tax=Sphingomonas sp. TF3 TaxID=2495580 RepID=UPI000F8786B5|nr:2Fe-2S iron-sulfur cluster binding domain-containing protein [Sphingomonas sp. TF3]RUN74777.1 2Fe-2S iron-sulfur cluster binding domain-containing protein [Sphingomonas sp. TF3]